MKSILLTRANDRDISIRGQFSRAQVGQFSQALKPAFYRRARHGYCRGSEPVRYVSEIQARYDGYVKLVP